MSKKTLTHVEIFDILKEVAKTKKKDRVTKFLSNLITHQSEENPTRIDVFDKDYQRIYRNNYKKDED